jgi:hypothetical protein
MSFYYWSSDIWLQILEKCKSMKFEIGLTFLSFQAFGDESRHYSSFALG